LKFIRQREKEKPCLGKWGTTLMACEMAWSLGSPLRPFSSANIFVLSGFWFCVERLKKVICFGAFCVFPPKLCYYFFVGMEEEPKLWLWVLNLTKCGHFVSAYLFMSSVTPNPPHSNSLSSRAPYPHAPLFLPYMSKLN